MARPSSSRPSSTKNEMATFSATPPRCRRCPSVQAPRGHYRGSQRSPVPEGEPGRTLAAGPRPAEARTAARWRCAIAHQHARTRRRVESHLGSESEGMASDMQTSIGPDPDVNGSLVSLTDIAARAGRVLDAARVARGELALEFEPTAGVVGGAPRRGPQLLSADARRHRGCVVVCAHQPVRFPSRARRRSVRGCAHREGARRAFPSADRRSAGLRPRARLARVLRAADARPGFRCA